MLVMRARYWQSKGETPFYFFFILNWGFINLPLDSTLVPFVSSVQSAELIGKKKTWVIYKRDRKKNNSWNSAHRLFFFFCLLHFCRRCSRRSASSRSPFLRTTTSSIHPLCTGSRSRVEPGSSASRKRDKSWRATGSRRQSPRRTLCPGPLKVWAFFCV